MLYNVRPFHSSCAGGQVAQQGVPLRDNGLQKRLIWISSLVLNVAVCIRKLCWHTFSFLWEYFGRLIHNVRWQYGLLKMELLIDFLAVNFLCCVKFEEKSKGCKLCSVADCILSWLCVLTDHVIHQHSQVRRQIFMIP